MKRDMELIREILLSIEAGQKDFDTLSNEHAEVLRLRIAPEKPLPKEDAVKLEGHLDLLEQAGLIGNSISFDGWKHCREGPDLAGSRIGRQHPRP